ncbi:hypothetical protein PC9H_001678 [Pleurotus ostreatus]|uniref:DUF6593 domain-containing protein n=1 Tax=Pleurotus ostreatus TaxID=5322 RepID=A0A8H7A6J9_PLEOS|nr:uncharacterized protein PC9H_001678 [Pleurotus ostreatus]KAF7441329.1 hypothetical protein PC9H_001678 [Pleurotus ostreatus]KAJ8699129.1 hypothetical protein PTI98_002281 [Pleurotus ostreatus]
MQFYITNSIPLNATFTDEDGQATYKTQTPFKFFADKTTTVSRVLHTNNVASDDISRKGGDNQGQLVKLAEIEWKNDVSLSRFKYREKDVVIGEFFYKGKQGWRGKDRVFTSFDGQEYRWRMNATYALLTLQDHHRTQIARYEPEEPQLIGKSKKATLEIYPEGEHMVDTIIVSFVYMEKLRKERDRDARAGVGDPVKGLEDD